MQPDEADTPVRVVMETLYRFHIESPISEYNLALQILHDLLHAGHITEVQ